MFMPCPLTNTRLKKKKTAFLFLWLLLGQLLPFLFGFGFEAGLSPYTPCAGLDLRTLLLQPPEAWGYSPEVNGDKSYRQIHANRCSWIRSRECECWQSCYRNNHNILQQRNWWKTILANGLSGSQSNSQLLLHATLQIKPTEQWEKAARYRDHILSSFL